MLPMRGSFHGPGGRFNVFTEILDLFPTFTNWATKRMKVREYRRKGKNEIK